MTTLPRSCLGCGVKIPSGSRCVTCGNTTARGLGAAWQRLARQVIREQPWCYWCGATSDLTADHLVPRSQGGNNVRSNIVTACRTCNSRRRDRPVSDYGRGPMTVPAEIRITHA